MFLLLYRFLSESVSRRWIAWLCKAGASVPTLALVILYLFTWRATVLLGHWPVLYLNDPKGIGRMDLLRNILDGMLCFTPNNLIGLIPLTAYSLIFVPILFSLAYWTEAPVRKRIWITVYALGVLALIFEPGERLAWYID